MSGVVIPFPVSSIVASMIAHWQIGKRGQDFHKAVRAEHADATLAQYNAAADVAWRIIFGVS